MKQHFRSLSACLGFMALAMQTIAQQLGNPVNNIPQAPGSTTNPAPQYPGLQNIYIGFYNYVRTQVPDVPADTWSASAAYTRQTTEFMDGLGRPLQTVSKNAHAGGYDLAQHRVYDNGTGKETFQYLPMTIPLALSDGGMEKPAFTRMWRFYNEAGWDEQPYSKTETDNTPLQRPTKQMAPGGSWVGSGRGVAFSYRSNAADEVRQWSIGDAITDVPVSDSSYAAGTIAVTKSTDEDGKYSLEYKDKQGKLLLKKVFVANNGQGETSHTGFACTYYVYDQKDQLRAVLSPEACNQLSVSGNTWTLTPAVAAGLCYRYLYDAKGRMIEKQIPGKGAEHFVYDKRERQVLYQDGNLRSQNKWSFTLYDALDRVLLTGIYEGSPSEVRAVLQAGVDANLPTNPSYLYAHIGDYNAMYHAEPIASGTVLTRNFYDEYSDLGPMLSLPFDATQFSGITLPSEGTVVPSQWSNHTRGLLVCTAARVLDPQNPGADKWIPTVYYYDARGRVIQTQTKNLKGGIDISSNIYYFQGMPWKTILRHQNDDAVAIPGATDGAHSIRRIEITTEANLKTEGGNTLTGRITQKIDTGIVYELAQFHYDHQGRMVTKLTPAGNTLNEYNMRGFLHHIQVRNPNNETEYQHLFEENLYYDKGFGSKLYNGNIAGITWKQFGNDAPVQSYGYSYDPLNRLSHAEYRREEAPATNSWVKNTHDYSAAGIGYDLNGNLQAMNQMGVPYPGASPIAMDQLSYTYAAGSNKLLAVADPVPASQTEHLPDFKDGAQLSEEYLYDPNGNMTVDHNKHITSITYNHLNKPEQIVIQDSGKIVYTYDATGNRLRKKVMPLSGPEVVYDYIGNFVYKDNELQYILNSEGRARPVLNAAGETKFVYDYFIKDHLGNVRSTMTAEPINELYLARHEIALANVEELLFDNIPQVRSFKPGGSPGDGMAAELNGGNADTRVGTAIMLRTNPGDRFVVSADAFYEGSYYQTDEVSGADVIESLTSALLGGQTYQGIPLNELPGNTELVMSALGNPNLAGQLDNLVNAGNNMNAPRAHLNVLFFNEQMELIPHKSTATQVLEYPFGNNGWATLVPSLSVNGSSQVCCYSDNEASGYVVVYVDNQSVGKTVWFDNITVEHYTGEMQEENHYYPFGLTLQTNTQTNLKENNYKYNSKELERKFGLEFYEYGARQYNSQIGRWNGIDPLADKYYAISPSVYCANNPVLFIDPNGKEIIIGGTKSDPGGDELAAQLASFVNEQNRYRLDGRTTLSINTDGLTQAGLESDPGLKFLIDMNNSSNKYYIELSDVAEGVDRNTGESIKIPLYNPESNPRGKIDMNFSSTDRGQEDYDSYMSKPGASEDRWHKFNALPKQGYDAQVTVPLRLAGLVDPESGKSKMGNALFHAMAEAYFRTDKNLPFGPAHKKAQDLEKTLPDTSPVKSNAPGKYGPDWNIIHDLQQN